MSDQIAGVRGALKRLKVLVDESRIALERGARY